LLWWFDRSLRFWQRFDPLDAKGPALARLLGALLRVSGSIDDLQVWDAPEGQECWPWPLAIIAPDLEEWNVMIDLRILEQPLAGKGAATLLYSLQGPDMIAWRDP